MKVLLIGDNDKAIYHPLSKVAPKIKHILASYTDLIITDDYDCLHKSLTDYEVIICYSDQWQDELNDVETSQLVSYVASGGRMIVVHNGISIARRHEFASITGAAFDSHPPACTLTFRPNSDHMIGKGIEAFDLFEEPYQYHFYNHVPRNSFLSYDYEGESYEAGWTTEFGKGKVVCICPGHNEQIFEHSGIQRLLKQSFEWCIK